ncbi:uncharacterized protein [Asterias amurensis]|uniref:uncharacterized protein n=1 Tax=Asterias amurensis TaxID=7602 RepID=UPI003AB306E8
MAASVTVESVLQKISEGHLECQICTDRFKEPKMLECSHSFCLECLQQLAQREDPPAQMLICPVCRVQTVLSEKGVADLRADFKSTSLVDEINRLESRQQNQRPGQGDVSKCSKHTQDLIMYCETCKMMVCITCISRDHRLHPVIEPSEALHKRRQQINDELAKVRESVNIFNIAVQDLDMIRKTLDEMFASTKDKISEKADKEIAKAVARIKGEEQKLVQEAERTYKDRVKKIENAHATNIKVVTKAQRKQHQVSTMSLGEDIKIPEPVEKLLLDLNKFTQIQPNKVPNALAFMDFEDGQKLLGKLVLKTADERQMVLKPPGNYTRKTWTLREELMTYMKGKHQMVKFSPCDVAAYSNGDIVVADFQNRSLMTAAGNSQSILKVQPIKGLSRPKRVAINKNDELIVLESNYLVKIYNRKYQLLSEFKLGGFSSNMPSCIAVDNNNLIAVGFNNNQDVISLYSADGSIIRTIHAGGVGTNLTFSKQQLIYTTSDEKKLVSVDRNGEVIFSVDINHSGLPYGLPYGLCCDEDGSIYVAVTEESSGEIQQYSPGDGNYLGCIIKGCNKPHSMALTSTGHLIVAAENSVQIYHQD